MYHSKELLAGLLTTATLLGSAGCARTVETPLMVPAGTILEEGSTIWDGRATSRANDDTYSVAGMVTTNLAIPQDTQASVVERPNTTLICFSPESLRGIMTAAGLELSPTGSNELCTFASNVVTNDGSEIVPLES